jgi:tRNA pseudouridine55 synthase
MPEVAFKVVCSKGTYIRSLANDFGKAMNSGAYLSSLCRTKIGDFKLENAWELDKLIEYLNTKVEIKERS